VRLKNKKYLGKSIPPHTVKNRLIEEVNRHKPKALVSEISPQTLKDHPKTYITEITSDAGNMNGVPLMREISSKVIKKDSSPKPVINVDYVIEADASLLVAEFSLPDVTNFSDVDVDIGEDRIVIADKKGGLLVDLFLPYTISSDDAEAEFNMKTKILHIDLPILK